MNRSTVLAAAALAAGTLALGGCASTRAPKEPALTKYTPPVGADAYVRAVSAREAGNNDEAIQQLQRALEANPNLRMARSTLGQIYMDRKDYEHAVPQLQAAADLDAYTLQNHYNLGLSYQLLNRLQEAAMAYLRGIRIDPNDFKTNVNLGLVYFGLNRLDDSIYYLERATRIEPQNYRAWSNIGVVYDARGNAVLAEASYRKALELDPNNESTLINLSANLADQKRGGEAVTIANQLISVNDTPSNRKRLGDAQVAATQWGDAERTYNSILHVDAAGNAATQPAAGTATSIYLPALNALGDLYTAHYENDLRMDDSLRQKAIATWKQSLHLQPNQPAVTTQLAKYQDPKLFR